MSRFTRCLSGCILVLGLSVFLWDSARSLTAYQEGSCSPEANGVFCGFRCHWPVVECEGDEDNLKCWLDRCEGGIQVLRHPLQPDEGVGACLMGCGLPGLNPEGWEECILDCLGVT